MYCESCFVIQYCYVIQVCLVQIKPAYRSKLSHNVHVSMLSGSMPNISIYSSCSLQVKITCEHLYISETDTVPVLNPVEDHLLVAILHMLVHAGKLLTFISNSNATHDVTLTHYTTYVTKQDGCQYVHMTSPVVNEVHKPAETKYM